MTDSYLTLHQPAEAIYKVQGSKFIGQAFQVHSPEEATDRVSAVKQEYYDATHNCSAYQVGLGDEALFHYDDDGEPSGTAGQPIYQVIQGKELTNLVLVVTRYFGGTKLGTGGLIRAYGETARRTIESGRIIRQHLTTIFTIHTTYDDISEVMRSVDAVGAIIIDQEYGEEIDLKVSVRQARAEKFRQTVKNLTGGRVNPGV